MSEPMRRKSAVSPAAGAPTPLLAAAAQSHACSRQAAQKSESDAVNQRTMAGAKRRGAPPAPPPFSAAARAAAAAPRPAPSTRP